MSEDRGLDVDKTNKTDIFRIGWLMGIISCISYLSIVYLLPLQGIFSVPVFPMKLLIEFILCTLTLLLSILWVFQNIRSENIQINFESEFATIELGKRVITTCCFEIDSVHAKILINEENRPSYNTAMLLALRSGMTDSTFMAFEAGVKKDTPFLRIFITASGNSVENTCAIVKREATRTEAILLASISNIELRLLHNDELRNALLHYNLISEDPSHIVGNNGKILFFEGLPHVSPSIDASQIGTLLSSLIKQKYDASFTCVFSKTSAKKEKRKMERKWKLIRNREKTKDDSLSDQALKKQLLGEYENVKYDGTWFDTTAYLYIGNDSVSTDSDAVKGLALSIWGGDGNLRVGEQKSRGRAFFRYITRRHLKKIRMHASRLAAYVNMPIQNLPVLTSVQIPSFSIPSNEAINHEIRIAKTVFEGRVLNDVGLKVEWLREHVAILGATGTGKTTLVKYLISELSDKTDIPWWIFDVKGGEYRDLMSCDGVLILNPGLDPTFVIDVFDSEEDSLERHSSIVFSILRELLKERNEHSELTPAMERLLRESIEKVVRQGKSEKSSIKRLIDTINKSVMDEGYNLMTRDALLNRLEVLNREPLGSVFAGGKKAVKISSLMNRRIVFDLRYVANTGGMDAARLLYNLVAKRIFDCAMRRGITEDVRHVVVLEEASNLVPESYTRGSAADVTTGESMVMLQRATGQGVIVVSTRPNISSNILANTSTKITFRLPYDSEIGARFLSLDSDQEKYLRMLKRGHAIIVLPNTNAFEIFTQPFSVAPLKSESELNQDTIEHEEEIADMTTEFLEPDIVVSEDDSRIVKEKHVFDRLGDIANHVIAYLASKSFATENELSLFLKSLDTKSDFDDISELIRDLLSIGTIIREAIPLVEGGFIYTLPGKGSDAVIEIIMEYILTRLEEEDVVIEKKSNCEIVINDRAFFILPDHIRASAIESVMNAIRNQMSVLGNRVIELIIIVRGSVAAAMLRELIDSDDEFESVTVVSAFASSLDTIIETLKTGLAPSESPDYKISVTEERTSHTKLIGAVHELSSSSGRAVQMRLWFGLLQDFVDVSNGCVSWDILMTFIENTAIQSNQNRTASMNIEDGRRALTELLADEVLVALRIGEDKQFIDLESGLWIVNSSILESLKRKSIEKLESILTKSNDLVSRNHGYYDICAGNKSYVVFPTQQQLNTLLNLHSEIACRKCNSKEVVVILTAAEYVDDNYMTPENLKLGTMADNMAALLI